MSVLVLGSLFGDRRRCWSCSRACRSPSRSAAWRWCSWRSSCRRPRSIRSRRTSTRRWPRITLLSIPLFILKGAAIGKSRAGQDLYAAHARLAATRIPAGWASPTCSPARCSRRWRAPRPATCSAIGSAGIPEMRKRGYSPRLRGRHHRRRRHARASCCRRRSP